MPEATAQAAAPAARTAQVLGSRSVRRRYFATVTVLSVLSVAIAAGLLVWDNPSEFGSDGYWRIAWLRLSGIAVLLLVGVSQAVATVSFQTVTGNRIITPSIMGFEALYVAVQTSSVYFFGIAGLVAIQGVPQFLLQVALMVGFALALYGWLFSGENANLQAVLLVGIVLGIGIGSVATFMRRLLTPSEFDVLAARLFGSVANADPDYLPVAIPLCAVAVVLLWARVRRLNVIALGRDTAIGLGVSHRGEVLRMLTLVAILISVSTSLVGPMTFFGFLVAMLTYQFADTYDHRLLFPVAALTGFVVLAVAYFVMKHLFSAQGVVSIIIEFAGGLIFLIVILRKGRL